MPVKRLWSNAGFRQLYIGRAASMAGDMIVPVALAFGVLRLSDSPAALGIVLAAGVVPRVLFILVGGAVADRLRPHRAMIWSDIVRAASQGAVALLLITDIAEVWHLVVLEAVYGTAAAFFNPASTAVVRFVVRDEDLQDANAAMGLTRSIAGVAGPAIAGVLVAAAGPGVALGLDALTFVVSALFLMRLPIPRTEQRLKLQDIRKDIAEGWREFTGRTWLWMTVAYFSLFHIFYLSGNHVLGPVIAERHLGGPKAWGFILAMAGVGGVLGGVLGFRLQPKRRLLALVGCGFVWLPELILLAVVGPVWAIGLASLAGGVTMTYANVLWETVLQHHVPPESLARVSAYDWLGSQLFYPLGLALVGPVAEVFGTRSTLMMLATGLLISTLVIISVPQIRRLREKATTKTAVQLRG
ncbi:MAG: MFS transporter [Actinobacteria bacterium]|nr:MFS transporter [Actinomycetota bacterium]